MSLSVDTIEHQEAAVGPAPDRPPTHQDQERRVRLHAGRADRHQSGARALRHHDHDHPRHGDRRAAAQPSHAGQSVSAGHAKRVRRADPGLGCHAQTLLVSQYSVNAKHGSLVVLDATSGGPYTEPFTVDYAYGAAQITAMFTQPLPERWIRFGGSTPPTANREVVIDLYRVAINPAKELDHHGRTVEVRAVGPGTGGSDQASRW